MSLPKYLCIMLYVKLMLCSGLPCIYGQLEEGGQSVMKLIGLVVCHGSVVNWRRSGVSLSWKLCSVMVFQGYMFNWLGGSIGVAVCHVSVVDWRRGWDQSVMKIRQCNCLPDIHAQLRGYMWSHCALHLTSWPTWTLHLKTWPNSMTVSNGLSLQTQISYDFISCHWHFEMGGISEHFIWQVDLVEHFIWKVDLILWLFQMGSHWRHRWGNSWSAVTGSFMGGISESEHCIWKYELISDVHVHCILFTTSDNYGGYIWQLIWTLHLKIWSHMWCPCALHLTTMEGYIWHLIWTLHLKIWTHFLISGLGLSVLFIWALHLKMGGISQSEHFIWKFGSQCALHLKLGGISESEHFIWKYGSYCALHLKLGGISESEHFIWKFEFLDI